jgi:hypothetical protein
MGGHMQLAHGVIIKTVVRETRGGDTRETRDARVETCGETRGETSETRETCERIQRPGDFVKRNSEIVKIKATPISYQAVEKDIYCFCDICCKELKLSKEHFSRAPNLDAIHIVCNDCLKRYKKEDLHEETVQGTTAIWWHVPDTNRRKMRIDYFHTEDRILLSEYWSGSGGIRPGRCDPTDERLD